MPLHKKHVATFEDLALTALSKPVDLHGDFWNELSLEKILVEIDTPGQPNSRYGLVSHGGLKVDIFLLDELVFQLRRRTIGLDWTV